jgi:hypothetical protein
MEAQKNFQNKCRENEEDGKAQVRFLESLLRRPSPAFGDQPYRCTAYYCDAQ